jgi:hypothetical protein
MSLIHRPFLSWCGALCLLLAGVAARAAPVHIEISGQFQLPGQAAPHTVEMKFDLDSGLPGAIDEFGYSFRLEDVAMQTRVDGHLVSTVAHAVGWFEDAAFNFFGVDVRIDDFDAPGDRMQFILTTPQSLFTGPTTQPALELLSFANLGGVVCHYPTQSGGACTSGTLGSGSYSAAGDQTVPVPSTALLAPFGLALAGWQLRRRRRTPA